MPDWPADTCLADEYTGEPTPPRRRSIHSDLVSECLAYALVTAAHDIPDPRRRNGPWRPGWRPFG